MAIEYTLSIIKPDATERNLLGKITAQLESRGLQIVAQKMMRLTLDQAKEFYAEHAERPFYDSLVTYMSSGPISVQVLKGEDAIAQNRRIMGATNPRDADEGTIRKEFGLSIDHNSVHGSDSESSAKREINFFFSDDEIIDES